MKKFLFPSFLLMFFIITASRPNDNPTNSAAKKGILMPNDTLMSVLALYGQYVFQREECGNCHEQGRSYSFISLDGLAGKYPSAWHYYHLLEPRSLSPGSSMPDYPKLFEQEIDEDILVKLIGDAQKMGTNYPKNFVENAASKLYKEASLVAMSLEKDKIKGESMEKKEVIALIAYLQQIPTSPEKRAEDSIQRAKDNFANALLFETQKKIVMPLALSNHKDTIAMGKPIFEQYCAVCHGKKGEGGVGPNFTDEYWLHGGAAEDMLNVIKYGVPEKGMISWKSMLSPSETGKVVCYIRSLKGTKPKNAKEPQGERY